MVFAIRCLPISMRRIIIAILMVMLVVLVPYIFFISSVINGKVNIYNSSEIAILVKESAVFQDEKKISILPGGKHSFTIDITKNIYIDNQKLPTDIWRDNHFYARIFRHNNKNFITVESSNAGRKEISW